MVFLLYNSSTVLGVFLNRDLLDETVNSLLLNNLVETSNLKIISFKENIISVGKGEPLKINLYPNTFQSNNDLHFNHENENLMEEFSSDNTSETLSKENSDIEKVKKQILELEKDDSKTEKIMEKTTEEKERENKKIDKKQKINYNLNLLKKRKEKLEEEKRVYEVDLELFNKFKNIKKENDNFVIPDMFEDKYKVFEILDNEEKLSFINFSQVYEKNTENTKWSKLFSGDGKERELLEITESESESEIEK